MKIKKIMFFANGNTAAFDENGQQIPSVQYGWFPLFIEHLQNDLGYSLDDLCDVDIQLPHGDHAILFKTQNGFNWK